MTSILGILTFFSALVTTACGLSCTECRSWKSTTTCSGDKVTCENGFLCGSSIQESIQDKVTTSGLFRGCAHKSECDLKGNIALSDIKIRTATTCCSTDDCTPPLPTLIPSNGNPNGLMCPTCDASGSITCDAEISLKCTGSEDRCLLRISEHNSEMRRLSDVSGPNGEDDDREDLHQRRRHLEALDVRGQSVSVSSIQGCATQSYCDRGIVAYTKGGTTYKDIYFCTNGGTSVQKVVLTPAVVCLLLMKWLF